MFDFMKLAAPANQPALYPLNLPDTTKYVAHFKQNAPSDFLVSTTLMSILPDKLDRAFDLADQARSALDSAVKAVGLPAKTGTMLTVCPGFINLMRLMTPGQIGWHFEDIYLQTAFCDLRHAKDCDDPFSQLGFAETWMDLFISSSGSINPTTHGHFTLEDNPEIVAHILGLGKGRDDAWDKWCKISSKGRLDLVRGYQLMIGDLYRENVGLHLREFMDPRNEIQIRVRAELTGKNPDDAWTDFVGAGHRYFLDSVRP